MIPPEKIFGRLGNRMFQGALAYSVAQDAATDYYFQDEKWFKKYEKQIKKLYSAGIGYDNRVSIHVRRGDYVGHPFYIDLTQTDYYSDAIGKFPNETFLVFSDDIPWCKSYFSQIKLAADYSEGRTEVEDLNLMASCKSNIIANSSFSWWAAYLNPNPGKKVFYPKNWYSDGIQRTKCPQDWMAL